MSVRIMSQVFEESKTEGNARLVLLALADCANDEGACWPSISSVARKANLSDPIAKKYLLSLAAIGLLSKEDRFASDGRQTSNFYQIDVNMIGKDFLSKEAIASVTPTSRKKEWVGVTAVNATPHNQDESGGGVTAVRLSYMNHQSEPSEEPSSMSVSEKKQTMAEIFASSEQGKVTQEKLNISTTDSGEAKPKAQSIVNTVAQTSPVTRTQSELAKARYRLCRMFNRKTSLPWSAKEEAALRKVVGTDEEDWLALEEYYRHRGKDGFYCRTAIITLLNNWGNDITRAHGGAESSKQEEEDLSRYMAGAPKEHRQR